MMVVRLDPDEQGVLLALLRGLGEHQGAEGGEDEQAGLREPWHGEAPENDGGSGYHQGKRAPAGISAKKPSNCYTGSALRLRLGLTFLAFQLVHQRRHRRFLDRKDRPNLPNEFLPGVGPLTKSAG